VSTADAPGQPGGPVPSAPGAPAPAPDPLQLLRSKNYVGLLLLAAIVGAPVAAAAYFFLKAINETQQYLFTDLPSDLGFDGAPAWWPLIPLAVGGLLVGLAIQYLPGNGGHNPAEGFKATGAPEAIELPAIVVAAFVTLAFGAVLGPEAPLIAIGGGLGALVVHLVKRDAPAMAVSVIGAAGSFAAISALLGSPVVGAFLLMEAAGLGGALMGVILVPGLLASGVGALVFIGLYAWTGSAPFTLAIPDIPAIGAPTAGELLWAVGIGIAAAVLGTVIKRSALALQPIVVRRRVLLTPLVGLLVAAAAVVFAQATDKGAEQVLFSGEVTLPPLLQEAASWTVGALVLLVLLKAVAYALSLSCFRGGPTFPGMFIGAAGGLALSHLPGLTPIAGAAMGIGAMTVAMLGLPLTSVLLTTLFLQTDAFDLMPLVIVAVVVSYVASARLAPPPASARPLPTATSDHAAPRAPV
jgi:H+/Cl- antiporter ClcA